MSDWRKYTKTFAKFVSDCLHGVGISGAGAAGGGGGSTRGGSAVTGGEWNASKCRFALKSVCTGSLVSIWCGRKPLFILSLIIA